MFHLRPSPFPYLFLREREEFALPMQVDSRYMPSRQSNERGTQPRAASETHLAELCCVLELRETSTTHPPG
jgi:hypothetical protein